MRTLVVHSSYLVFGVGTGVGDQGLHAAVVCDWSLYTMTTALRCSDGGFITIKERSIRSHHCCYRLPSIGSNTLLLFFSQLLLSNFLVAVLLRSFASNEEVAFDA
jgi:hypothetical protein